MYELFGKSRMDDVAEKIKKDMADLGNLNLRLIYDRAVNQSGWSQVEMRRENDDLKKQIEMLNSQNQRLLHDNNILNFNLQQSNLYINNMQSRFFPNNP